VLDDALDDHDGVCLHRPNSTPTALPTIMTPRFGFLGRYGAHVTILERSGRLLSRQDPRPGELTEHYVREEGIDVRTGTSAVRARKDGDDTVVELDSGDEVRCDVIIAGTGRTPRAGDLGLESVGVELGDRGEIVVDDHCRAGDGVWALSDVTGVMPLTHVAMYMARVIADNIAGKGRTAATTASPEWSSKTLRSPPWA
jgi:pyruvate/2-oxoglutarate dehydrogenase complex dihydrolipoamide dehydrogenase (E3) component